MRFVIASVAKQSSFLVSWIASSLALLAMTFITSCTPVEQAYNPIADNPPQLKEDVFVAPDGALLPYRHWQAKSPKAILISLHGFNDYSNAFTGIGEYFAARGISVYAYDQRGFGASVNTGIWGGEKNFIADLAAWVRYLKSKHPRLPIHLLGESMGAAVAISAVTSPDFLQPDKIVLVAPALWGGETMNPVFRFMTILSAHIMPSYTVTGSDLEILASDNIEMLRAMSRDPLIIKATRMDAIYGLVNLMDTGYEKLAAVKTPLLFLYGGKDEVIEPSVMEDALAHLPENADCIYYPDGYHMLLRDLHGEAVMHDIFTWLGQNKARGELNNCNSSI